MITGVRQCGKTYVKKEFGEKHLDVNRIISELEFIHKTKIVPGETLLTFDKRQECPKAITALKYSCEDCGELHLVCAGLLLGVALKRRHRDGSNAI